MVHMSSICVHNIRGGGDLAWKEFGASLLACCRSNRLGRSLGEGAGIRMSIRGVRWSNDPPPSGKRPCMSGLLNSMRKGLPNPPHHGMYASK